MRKIGEMIGRRFGRLLVVASAPNRGVKTAWLCQCDCGNQKTIRTAHLLRGLTISCGCRKKEGSGIKHGLTRNRYRPPEYIVWAGMKNRCLNEKSAAYKEYGGRGITVCERWRESFEAFLSDMGPRPSLKHTIERLDNNTGYEPSNCVWAVMKTQARNRRNSRLVVYLGQEMTIAEMAEITGINYMTLYYRAIERRDLLTGARAA